VKQEEAYCRRKNDSIMFMKFGIWSNE